MALSPEPILKPMAKEYETATHLPVTAQDSSIHQMPPGDTMHIEIAISLATISIKLTAGAQTTNMSLLSTLMMVTGSKHDSVSGMFAINRITQVMGYGC